MNLSQIEENVQTVMESLNRETFIYNLLLAYGQPKATVSRLQKGNFNLSKIPGEIALKKKLFFKEAENEDLHDLIDTIQKSERISKLSPRFIIVTDYETFLAVDTKTSDTLDIPINEFNRHFDFFLPWAGMEKKQAIGENPADVKAAEKMAKLYDEIRKDNEANTPEEIHNLNVFLSRLLFCFFAEDTEIFTKTQFTNAVASHTQQDGSDLNTYLDNLFTIMNTPVPERRNLPAFLDAFPYVNGGLFRNRHTAPTFTRRSRQILIECGSLQWKDIHPDIFGSMIQAVVTPEQRGGFGMHYTSVPNIMKVIEPLFLDELKEEFEKAKNSEKKLNDLRKRLSRLKIFDPACGSGNFLIIAYKELQKLEIAILQQLATLQNRKGTGAFAFDKDYLSVIQLSQFYGIELDDFAHEIAILSLWLAQHQMNMKFKEQFGAANPTLPLQAGGNIVHGNATRLDWEEVCPKNEGDEIYILGNPPYLGARLQKPEHKLDMQYVFDNTIEYNNLDYIGAWFYKGARFLKRFKTSKLAFVSTNSICQGEQVAILWPSILNENLEINFAYKPFLWSNNAKDKAAVYCIILGLRATMDRPKYLFKNNIKQKVENINAYLIDYKNIFIEKRRSPISNLPMMVFGSMANDEGHLILNEIEKKELITQYPSAEKYLKKLVGAVEFTNNTNRWCIWVNEDEFSLANKIEPLRLRFTKVKNSRSKSKRSATKELASKPYAFGEIRHEKGNSILIPRVTSERREYLQCGFFNDDTVVLDRAAVIYGNHLFMFGVLSSKMHTVWTHAVSGRLKMDINYAVGITYNNFPFPSINYHQIQTIESSVYNVLAKRENHTEMVIAELYDPDKMPADLREAHHQLDLAVERCYRSKPFESDEERLEYLFKLYEQMINEEKQRAGEMIFEQPKTKRRKK